MNKALLCPKASGMFSGVMATRMLMMRFCSRFGVVLFLNRIVSTGSLVPSISSFQNPFRLSGWQSNSG